MAIKAKLPDIRRIINEKCLGNCNSADRKAITENGICNLTYSLLDELPIRCVGSWAYRKIFYLLQYFGIFTQGMKDIWKGNLNYIEICSGPGRCVFRDTKEEVDGTAIAIINHNNFKYVKTATFIDLESEVVDILNNRINLNGKLNNANATIGDYNNVKQIEEILSNLPQNCLNLVFIDPTDCSFPFETIKCLYEVLKKVDFIINVPLFSDAARHLRHAILNPKKYETSIIKYSNFLGDNTFFFDPEIKRLAKSDGTEEDLRNRFVARYENKFKELGYVYIDRSIRVENMYYLWFISQAKLGLTFWHRILRSDELGQMDLLA